MTGQILEVAAFKDLDDKFDNIVGQPLSVVICGGRTDVVGNSINFFDSVENACRCILGRGNDRVQLALDDIDTRAAVIFRGGIQGGDFFFGFLNGICQCPNFGFQQTQFSTCVFLIVLFGLCGEFLLLFYHDADVRQQLKLEVFNRGMNGRQIRAANTRLMWFGGHLGWQGDHVAHVFEFVKQPQFCGEELFASVACH